MTIENHLKQRSSSCCELCSSSKSLSVYEVPPTDQPSTENCVLLCANCKTQIEQPETMDVNHWRCLNDSMWNPQAAVQVVAWRVLDQLRGEGWPQDLLDMLYLEEEVQQWAEALAIPSTNNIPTLDSNGTVLQAGDQVTLIKDLVVKGANFTAKRGTSVKNIALTDNPEQIEGKVNGMRIVLLTQFLKKA